MAVGERHDRGAAAVVVQMKTTEQTRTCTYTGHRNSSSKNDVGLPTARLLSMNCRNSVRETGAAHWGP